MLTDVFFRRYEESELFIAFAEAERRFIGQAAQLLVDEVHPRNEGRYKKEGEDPATMGLFYAHSALSRELGVTRLTPKTFQYHFNLPNGNRMERTVPITVAMQTMNYLTAKFLDSYSPDLYIKQRISFIELALQAKASQLRTSRASFCKIAGGNQNAVELLCTAPDRDVRGLEARRIIAAEHIFAEQILELNERFRQAGIPLSYHNDLIQISADQLTEQQIEKPFWQLVADAKWENVDTLIKEAIDRRDSGQRDTVSPAMQALESVIKIISDDKGWTTGNERGAANYIDNLVPVRNGVRFIEVWEKDALVRLFGDLRNLFGHGPGSAQLPTLTPERADWVIDSIMAWVKSLIRRL